MIVKQEDFQTAEGISGLKSYGTFPDWMKTLTEKSCTMKLSCFKMVVYNKFWFSTSKEILMQIKFQSVF
jgi:hypothetical protein